tara:strand:- start:1079 stop:1744 length:666 start_codon:yes stop_codon:yes gene_type:complete
VTEKKDKTSNRLKSLDLGKDKQRQHSLKYTKIIKSLRIILPISAGAIILLLFTWQQIEDANIVPPQEPPAKTPRTIGKNELVNPKFESRDNKGNPYIITAVRALQGQTKEDDLILLEKPFADIALDDGRWIAIKSNQSAYKQTSKRLLLKDNVEIFYDEGYTLTTEELDVDMMNGTAQNNIDVHVQGPKGFLEAKGLNADQNKGTLIFKGPAKLTLTSTGL